MAGRASECDDRFEMMTSPTTTNAATDPARAHQPAVPLPRPRLHRRDRGQIMAGVAGGIADHLRLPAWAARLAFVALLPLHGLGLVLYAVFWVVLRPDPRDVGVVTRRRRVQRAAVFGVLALAFLFLLVRFNGVGQVIVFASIGIVALGVALSWQRGESGQGDKPGKEDKAGERDSPWSGQISLANLSSLVVDSPNRTTTLVRWGLGGALVILGVLGLLAVGGQLQDVRNGLVFTAAMIAGLAIVIAPWIFRMLTTLREERYARVRSQERAEVAAIVHDKVMHTLALIQRRADDATEVQRLARKQERELRTWLYKPTASPEENLTAALESAAAEVEDTYAVVVSVVVVGDAPLTPPLVALVRATREALVNSAKHSGATEVSLYAEVASGPGVAGSVGGGVGEANVYVRDRGRGFVLDEIASDRHGVRDSITGRMLRHGGNARVRTAPGEGTEVSLRIGLRENQ